MSSRRRLYLNLKASILSLFKTPAHYLKEITGKQSLYEKPYFDKDYRQMHLNLSVPTWKRPKPKPGIWPPSGGSYWSKFIFQEGECSFYDTTGECGELINFNASIDQLLMGPHSLGTTYTWNATSSNQELAIVQPIEQHLFGASATVPVQLSEENSGTVTICITARITEGSFIKEITFPVPLPWWDPKYDSRWQNLRYMLANVFPTSEKRLQAKNWSCGCIDLEVECVCQSPDVAWGAGSDTTIVRNGTANLELDNHNDCNYTWSVVGTGFTLDSVSGLSNTLNADGSACGTAIITVTAEDNTVVTGYVKCSVGTWKYLDRPCNAWDTNYACGGSQTGWIYPEDEPYWKFNACCQSIEVELCHACDEVYPKYRDIFAADYPTWSCIVNEANICVPYWAPGWRAWDVVFMTRMQWDCV